MSINIDYKLNDEKGFWDISVEGELDVSTADKLKEYLHNLADEKILDNEKIIKAVVDAGFEANVAEEIKNSSKDKNNSNDKILKTFKISWDAESMNILRYNHTGMK